MEYDQRFADFNESSYAHAATAEVTHWLIQQHDLMAAPVVPDLTDEADLGYDVGVTARWGMVFLQYKLSEYIRGHNASEYWFRCEPYFRFSVRTKQTSNGRVQHNTLCDLEGRQAALGGLVYYMAPLFLTEQELFEHLLNQAVVDNSVFASPLQLGLVAARSTHRYTFTSQRDVVPFSEPGPERSGGSDLLTSGVQLALEGAELELLSEFLGRVAETLRELSGLDIGRDVADAQQVALVSSALSLSPILVRLGGSDAGDATGDPTIDHEGEL